MDFIEAQGITSQAPIQYSTCTVVSIIYL